MENPKPRVAVISENNDLIGLIESWLRHAGFETMGMRLQTLKQDPMTYASLMRFFDPEVMVIDIPIPYDDNWQYLNEILVENEYQRRGFVMATANKGNLEKIIGKKTTVMEIAGKPLDLRELVKAVKRSYKAFKNPSKRVKLYIQHALKVRA